MGEIKLQKMTVVAIVLAILIIISAMQAVQLSNIKEKVTDGKFTVSSPSGNAVASSSAASRTTAPARIAGNLPEMVGGC